MVLQNLTVINYKNIKNLELTPSPNINCFVGENGSGKTNILDSIYYSAFCKSLVTLTDRQAVNFESDFFLIEAQYLKNTVSNEKIVCSYSKTKGKKIKRNDKSYDKLSEHIGVVPTILVSPYDTALINDAAEERRKFLNIIISQTDREYLQTLIAYNTLLAQRNSLLKNPEQDGFLEIIEVIDLRLSDCGNFINTKRREFVEKFSQIVSQNYALISDMREEVSITYKSKLNEVDFLTLLNSTLEKDLALGYTSTGVQRDDLVMEINSTPIRKYGSWGQQKSFLIALKLSEFDMIAQKQQIKPILLLDDIFDKLDLGRVTALLNLVKSNKYGQIFITDSNKVRLESILENLECEYSLFSVNSEMLSNNNNL